MADWLLAAALLAAAIFGPTAARAQEPPAAGSPFGVIESVASPDGAADLGAGWTRLNFNWGEMQAAGPDEWRPPVTDEALGDELAAGRLVVGLLIGIPEWARDAERRPLGLWRPTGDPANHWAAYVGRVVAAYRGRIDHWVIWNEPDIPKSELAHTWDGTVADFAQLLRTGYLAAKAVNPDAVIHLPAFTYWADYYAGTEQYMARLLDEITADPAAPDHGYYFDVATAHLYFQPSQIYDLLALFRGILAERGLDRPIWLVETNAPPRDDPAWPVPNWTLSVTQAEQAAFMPQAMAAALAAGAERVAVYKLQDTPTDRAANPEPFGLIRQDGSRRPAFEAYRVAIGRLAGVRAATREQWDHVGQIRLDQGAQSTTLLFARLPQPQEARVPATTGTAELIDLWGVSQTITTTSGFFTVELPPARCSHSIGDYCMIGGPPFYLVQAAPPATPTPRPTATPAPSATPSPTPLPTPSATLAPRPSPAPPTIAAPAEPPQSPPAAEPAAARGSGPYLLGVALLLGLILVAYARGRRAGARL